MASTDRIRMTPIILVAKDFFECFKELSIVFVTGATDEDARDEMSVLFGYHKGTLLRVDWSSEMSVY
jgi:hypothetical protein